VQAGRFAVAEYLSTAGTPTAREDVSEGEMPASQSSAHSVGGGTYQPGPKSGTWALLVATSTGWDNYRHQADVLAQYQRLRSNGVPADHIIVVMADDLVRNPRNPKPGTVRYSVAGPNLYRDVHVDYTLHDMTAERLLGILDGDRSADTPRVVDSGPGDDVYVFVAGHGNDDGVYIGLSAPVPPANSEYPVLTPEALGRTVATMAARHRYRRLLITVEACQAGAFGGDVDAPGALLIGAASPVEDSFSANYDASSLTWLADQFSYQLWTREARPAMSLRDLYRSLYLSVDGSHVSAYGPNFGDPASVPLSDFTAG
jgi:glycosylphosphatidylinositol transamidase (GPIT) subunit GPI8